MGSVKMGKIRKWCNEPFLFYPFLIFRKLLNHSKKPEEETTFKTPTKHPPFQSQSDEPEAISNPRSEEIVQKDNPKSHKKQKTSWK